MSGEFLTVAMAGGPAAQGGGGSSLGMMLPMLIIFAIMYFMLIRPQQRKEKERQKMITAVKSGDRVLFGGGILGTIANVKETTFVVKIADSVKVEVLRASVQRVLDKGEKADGEANVE
jgi:preprotein translocase subunit YajC